MRIATTLGSEAVGTPMAPAAVVDGGVRAEQAGIEAAWSVHFSRGIDALTALTAVAGATRRLQLGVGVVPTYPRHPAALAQQAATLQALSGGRLTLGVGVSHRPVIEGMLGMAYDQPVAHMAEYLSVLGALLTDGRCQFEGAHYRVDIEMTVPHSSPVPVLVAALSPMMAQAAGTHADGVVTWLAGPRSLEEVIVPSVCGAAADARRPPPRVVAALPVAVTDDAGTGRAAAAHVFKRYAGLVNYQRLFEREGVSGPGDLAVVGPEHEVRERIERLADVGVTEVWAVPFAVAEDDTTTLDRTQELLGGLRTSDDAVSPLPI